MAWSPLIIPPLPNISISGTILATSAHFLSAKGRRTLPVVPPAEYYLALPTGRKGSPEGSGSIRPGIVLVSVTAFAPFARAESARISA
jgi:hypothetical protein